MTGRGLRGTPVPLLISPRDWRSPGTWEPWGAAGRSGGRRPVADAGRGTHTCSRPAGNAAG